ncbi:zinc ribbon domain-containing protein [Bacillus suaedae]|uniref:Zinc-ribbon domain-containing protein n=1 Tax=Halalkalibacter suaedae TaxID=2822140 RepID=A0A940WPP1_9BACI|nr:zinc-ribbon domain-containing protein [Bacillus suaedae]MBP3950240.1 hypothetical protein [Bacillus suaedae]
MKFCTSCGTKVEESKEFCNECGAKLTQKSQRSGKQGSKAATLPSLSTLSKKTKLIVGGVIAIAVIGFGLYKFGESYTDKGKQLNQFTEYIEEEDVKGIIGMIESSNESLEITEEHIKDLLVYLNEFPHEKEELLAALHEDSRSNGISVLAQEASGDFIEEGTQLITFEKRGKQFLFYDNYDFIMQAFPINLYSNYEELDLTFSVNGEEVSPEFHDGHISLGPVLPGNYLVTAHLSSEFVELEKEIEVAHFTPSDHWDLYVDVDYFSIETNASDATIWIDGVDTGITASNAEVGPVLLDGSMMVKLEKETPFGKVESPEVAIEDYYQWVGLEMNSDQRNDILSEVEAFYLNYSKALAYQDKSLLEANSFAVTDFVSTAYDDNISEYWDFAGYLTDVQVDLDSFELEEEDGQWFVSVSVQDTWMSDEVYPGDEISLEEETNAYRFHFKHDQAQGWVIDYVDYIWGLEGETLETLAIDVGEQRKQLEESPVFESITAELLVGEIGPFVKSFVESSIQAINSRDFSIVEDKIDPASSEYAKEVSDYINYLEEKGITEDLYYIDVVDITDQGDNKYHVAMYEEYYIYYEDGTSSFKRFDSSYEVSITDEGPKLYKLIETKEVE